MAHPLRFTIRSLRRTPVLSVVASASVAISVALGLLIAMVLRQSVLLALPFPQPDRVVTIMASGSADCPICPDFVTADIQQRWHEHGVQSLTTYGLYRSEDLVPEATDAAPRIRAALVRGDFFKSLGVTATVGRLPDASELESGDRSIAVISSRYASRRGWNPAANALGKDLVLNGRPVVVVGVLAAHLELPADADLWLNDALFPAPGGAGAQVYTGLGRLRAGVTSGQAADELTQIGIEQPSGTKSGFRPTALVAPLEEVLRRSPGAALPMLAAIALAAFLLAGANLQTLLIVRSLDNAGAMAVRLALGATRGGLAVMVGLESLLLAFGGAIPGIGLALAGRAILAPYLADQWGRPVTLTFDALPLAAAFALPLALALFGAIGPALHTISIDLRSALQEHTATATAGRRRIGFRSALVAVEAALAIVLAGGTSLLIRAYGSLSRIDLGYDPSQVVVAPLDLSGTSDGDWSSAKTWATGVLESAGASSRQPGAIWVGTSPSLAVEPHQSWTSIEGHPDPTGNHRLISAYHVSEGFFSLFGLRPSSGRVFQPSDRAGSAAVVIINQAAESAWWPGESAVGRRMKLAPKESNVPWLTVVGVVPNTQPFDRSGLFMRSYRISWQSPLVFLPFDQSVVDVRGQPLPLTDVIIGVSAHPEPRQAMVRLQAALQQQGGRVPPATVTTLKELQLASGNYPEVRFSAQLLGSMAGVALLLAAIGVFGVLSENIRARTAEIGIRRALGAGSGSIAFLVSRSSLTALGIGLALGGLLAVTFKSLLLFAFFGIAGGNRAGLLLSVSPQDPRALLLASAAFLAGIALALIGPIRHAAAIEPMEALRRR